MFKGLRRVFDNLAERIAYTGLSPQSIEEIGYSIILELVENDIAYDVAENLIKSLGSKLSEAKVPRFSDKKIFVKEKLREYLLELFISVGELDLRKEIEKKRSIGKPLVIVFLGPNGHGKTLTVAKLAYWLKKRGYKVVMAASDTFRAGAIEQVEKLGERIGVKVIKHRYGADPAAVAFDAIKYAEKHGIDAVLIDTAGRLQTDKNLMDEMKKIARVTKPDIKIFVGDALTGNDAFEQATRFNEEVGIDAIILTKVDSDAKGGAAISTVYATKKPIIFMGVGQGVEDLIPFDPKNFIENIIPL